MDTLVFGRRSGMQIREFVQSVDLLKPATDDCSKTVADQISGLMAADGKEMIGDIMSGMQEVMMDKVSVSVKDPVCLRPWQISGNSSNDTNTYLCRIKDAVLIGSF